MLIDLQLHSRCSDGYLSPTELALSISKKGIRVASLTDHNTTRGLHEFHNACKKFGIKTIPGLELYTYVGQQRFSILWYNFDETSTALQELLQESQDGRRHLASAALHRLEKHGFQMNIKNILHKYPDYIPLNHLVDDILSVPSNMRLIKKELKLRRTPEEIEVIRHYLHHKNIGKLHNSLISLERIFKLKKTIGGQIILCHPAKDRDYETLDTELWKKLHKKGLDGVEVLSPHHSYDAIGYIQKSAREIGFIETGGSDYHRNIRNGYPIERSWDYFSIDSRFLNGIEKIIDA